jgi:hypothetical protein
MALAEMLGSKGILSYSVDPGGKCSGIRRNIVRPWLIV